MIQTRFNRPRRTIIAIVVIIAVILGISLLARCTGMGEQGTVYEITELEGDRCG